MSFRKIIMILAVLLLTVAAFAVSAYGAAARRTTTNTATASATDSVGIVDMNEVMNHHPNLEAVHQQMLTLSRQKENEARAAYDKETDVNRRAQAVQSKRMELAQEQQKLMAPIYRDCEQAVREVAVRKKLTLVLDKFVVLIGGVDITQDVIQQLSRKK